MNQVVCNRCVMDKSAEEIVFTENGCNFCEQAQKALREIEAEKHNLFSIIEKIKKDGKNRTYDVLCGLSGGVDSSTVLHYAVVRYGLRPLCFSVDNEWQDSRAQENIMKIVEGLRVPFYRYTIDIKLFHRLQSAFMRAGQKNIEIPTDHILLATSYEMAAQYGIKWIISGGNVASESILPKSWGYQPRDLVHIKSVYKWATGKKLTGLPTCSLLQWNIYKWWHGIKTFYLLDYLEYERKEAEKMLIDKYDFVSTGEKHEESVFTKWFQNFYLFELKNIDKRKAHYSSLINSGQMTRRDAMIKLQQNPIYPKLGIEDKVRKYKHREHSDFAVDKNYERIASLIRLIKRFV